MLTNYCGGLTLAGHKVPTKTTLSFSSAAEEGTENIKKGSWVKIKTEKHHSQVIITAIMDLTWGKRELNLLANQNRIMRNKTKS